MKNGLKVRLLEKPGPEDTSLLIMEIDDNGNVVIPLNALNHRCSNSIESLKNISKYGLLASEWFGELESEREGCFCTFLSRMKGENYPYSGDLAEDDRSRLNLGENVISSSTYETQETTESFVVDQTEGSSSIEGNDLQIAETDSFSMDDGNYQEETEDLGSEGYVNLEDDLVRLADDSVSGYVRLFINGTSVIPENGEVRSLDEFGNTLWYVDLTEKDSWVASAMSDSDKDNLGWSEGSEVIIFTGEGTSFGITGKVSVNATFVDGNLAEIPINKEFDLQDDGYEVSIRYAGRQSLLKNSIIYGEVCVDDSIKYATLSVEDETIAVVSKDTIEFVDGSDVFSITLLESGRTTLTADFYDAEGNLVGETDVFVGVLQEQ